jgi:hypothetical protein
MTTDKTRMNLDRVVHKIMHVTQQLLEDGAEPSAIAFALTSIAADMGLQLTNDPYKVFPVLLDAIAQQAKCRLRKDPDREGLDLVAEGPPEGTTIH